MWSLADETPEEPMHIAWPYFETAEPQNPDGWDEEVTYAGTGQKLHNSKAFSSNHGLGEIVTALIDSGLRIEFLHEHQILK